MWLLVGCWQPDPYLPPVPEQLSRLSTEIVPEVEDAAEPAEGEAEAPQAPEGEDAPDAEEAPAAPPPDAYPSRTVGVPLTIVDDVGKPVQVLTTPHVAVLVLLEEPPVRKRVRCTGCTPPVDGWLQFDNVEPK